MWQIKITFDPETGGFNYKYEGCGFIDALGLLEMAKLHIFTNQLRTEWKAKQARKERDNGEKNSN